MIDPKPTEGRDPTAAGQADAAARRREFLRKFGRFAAVTPPTIAVILAAELIPTEAFGSGVGRRPADPPPTPRPGRRPYTP